MPFHISEIRNHGKTAIVTGAGSSGAGDAPPLSGRRIGRSLAHATVEKISRELAPSMMASFACERA